MLPPASSVTVEKAMTLRWASRAIGLTASTSAASSGPRISRAPSAIAARAALAGPVGVAAGVARHQGQPIARRFEQRQLRGVEDRLAELRHWRPTAAPTVATLAGSGCRQRGRSDRRCGRPARRPRRPKRRLRGESGAGTIGGAQRASASAARTRTARREADRARHRRGKGNLRRKQRRAVRA